MHDRARRHRGFSPIVVALALAWVLILARDAQAYIDPGAGSMLVQLLLAGTAGVAVLGKLFWLRIRRALGMAPPESQTSSTEDSPVGHDPV
jgi:hypothetical protein